MYCSYDKRKYPCLNLSNCSVEVAAGWCWLVKTLFDTLDHYFELNDAAPEILLTEIYQKMGFLQVRHNYEETDQTTRNIIHAFEASSKYICEWCCSIYAGGDTRNSPWIVNACASCLHKNPRWQSLEWVAFTETPNLSGLRDILPLIRTSVYKDRLVELASTRLL
ncbi:MAG: hypothetical protein V4539_10290 [Bacteroidota bacterium]